jgi:hypothetical protein
VTYSYKAQIISISKYLNTKYAEDHFVNIVKSHESNQPNISSTITTAAKVVAELNQSDEKCDTRKEGIQHTKARLVESFKKIVKAK